MLVAVAAVLRHEPIFTKPLGFVDGSASAVEQLAMQRTIGIPNPWHSVLIPKFCAAFFTRHQKELFHFCIRPFRFHVSGTQHAHFITNGCATPLTLAPKSAADFRRECALTHSKAFGKNAQPAPERCRSERVWDFPTSILQRKICICAHECTACWYNVIDETKTVSSKTVIWLCRFPKHSNIEVLTGAESGKTACLVSIQELLTA